MKKTTSLLTSFFLCLSVFAAEPAANFVLSEFTGSAEFGFKTDFSDSDNVKMGMYNIPTASIKFGFVKGGDKTTTGDGVWGELKISAEETTISNAKIKLGNTKPVDEGGTDWKPTEGLENNIIIDEETKDVFLKMPNLIPEAKVETAKIHFSDNKFYASLDLLKPTLKYEGNLLSTATSNTKYYLGKIKDVAKPIREKLLAEIGKDDTEGLKKDIKDLEEQIKKANEGELADLITQLSEKKKEIAEARNKLSLLPPAPTTTDFTVGASGLGSIGNDKGFEKEKGFGFGFGFGVKDAFDANFKLVDNGVKANSEKIYGLAFDISLKAFKDLTTNFMGSFNFNEDYYGLASQLAYKFMINEKLFIQPGISYALNSTDDKLTHNLTGGVLLGWGTEEYKPKFKYFNEKTKEGLAISVSSDLKNGEMTRDGKLGQLYGGQDNLYYVQATLTKIVASLYDQSLFNILSIGKYGILKTGFSAIVNIYKGHNKSKKNYEYEYYFFNNVFTAGLRYLTEFSSMYLELGGDMEYIFNETKTITDDPNKARGTLFDEYFTIPEDSFQIAWSLKVGSKKLIDNTDIYALYEGEYKDKTFVNHAVSFGTKIHF